MERREQNCKPTDAPPPGALIPANCNHEPIRWRLDDTGLTYPIVGGVGELCAALACYAETKEDRRDLQSAAALVWDVANRLRRRRMVGGRANG